MSLNVWSFTGRLGKDAEVRSTNSGDKITSWSVAVDIGYGEKKTAMWVDCQIWGDRGEKLVQYLKKGQEVGITGQASLREWTDRDGGKRQTLTCRVNDVALVGGRPQSADEGSGYSPRPTQQRGAPSDLDDEIPF